jgi:2-polyprenyl-6-methoxyphenol hydroxylase-like FAD-dependent oxidoreductase
LGAGPAGLYAAILLAISDPSHQILVCERNPAGATYGFGVVLSDRTLTAFRDADPQTYSEITAHQTTWEAIETYVRGECVRCEGHYYLGIARKRLLDILQARALALGVDLRYEADLQDLSPFAGCDLIVGADGVNSLMRRQHADAFGTRLEAGSARYIWLGTDWTPSAFTFIFHETEYGLFQAHIYPYAPGASTCIVMCADGTWRQAGLDHATEAESLRFCRDLLAPYLGGGASFQSNRSLWSTFTTVTNQRWSHGNMVLLGDATHTAHWSIGSGTKLAMESAIVLAGALHAEPEIPAALRMYETIRRPAVEKLQQAGRISQAACETADRLRHLTPEAFTFGLLTRSGRLTYQRLRERDSTFADRLAHAGSPLELRGLRLPNRVVTEGPEDRGQGLSLIRPGNPRPARGLVGLLVRDAAEAMAAGQVDGTDLLLLETATPSEVEAVRAVWPGPLGVLLPDATPARARSLADRGCDLVALNSPPQTAERIKHEAGVATLFMGAAWSLDEISTLVAGARADLCLLAAEDPYGR